MFQVASNDGTNIYYSTFASGAITRKNGTRVTGCYGADIQHANAAWLSSMILGGNLDQMMFFMSHRDKPIHGILFPSGIGRVLEQIISGRIELRTWKRTKESRLLKLLVYFKGRAHSLAQPTDAAEDKGEQTNAAYARRAFGDSPDALSVFAMGRRG